MKREKYLELAHKPYSRSPTISTISSGSDYSDQILNVWKLFSPRYRRRKGKDNYVTDIPVHIGHVRSFSLDELEVATQSFSEKNIFSYGLDIVHKGWLADGSPVAVKRFKNKGYTVSADYRFQLQVDVYSIVEHPNVLRVVGFCSTKEQRLLIYPLMPYGSVASCLKDRPAQQPFLNWRTRKEIAMGTARGLVYLHDECEKRIIHCNIKASNILLNEDLGVVIAGFGSAIIVDRDSTYVLRDAVRGTIGYIAPEYWINHVCSEKTDVYSYGVFLLELITGQTAFGRAGRVSGSDMKLLNWFKINYKEKEWKIVADPNCGGEDMEEVVEQLIVMALLCTQDSPERRPKMSEIVRMLEVGGIHGESAGAT